MIVRFDELRRRLYDILLRRERHMRDGLVVDDDLWREIEVL